MKLNKSEKHWVKQVKPVSSLSHMLIAQGDETFSPNLLDHKARPEKFPWRTQRQTMGYNSLILSVTRTNADSWPLNIL